MELDVQRTWLVAGNAHPRLNIINGARVSNEFYDTLVKYDVVSVDDLSFLVMPDHEVSTFIKSLEMELQFNIPRNSDVITILAGPVRHHLKQGTCDSHHHEQWLFAEIHLQKMDNNRLKLNRRWSTSAIISGKTESGWGTDSVLVPIRRISEIVSEMAYIDGFRRHSSPAYLGGPPRRASDELRTLLRIPL